MSDASLPAREAAACDAKRSSIALAKCGLAAATELEPDSAPLRASALIATFRCDAPARCGAFADERRSVAGNAGSLAY
jgi:hypothetical protein